MEEASVNWFQCMDGNVSSDGGERALGRRKGQKELQNGGRHPQGLVRSCERGVQIPSEQQGIVELQIASYISPLKPFQGYLFRY